MTIASHQPVKLLGFRSFTVIILVVYIPDGVSPFFFFQNFTSRDKASINLYLLEQRFYVLEIHLRKMSHTSKECTSLV